MDKFIAYIKGTKHELRHVNWPTGRLTALYTALVVVISLVISAYLGAFDFLFSHILELFVI